MDLEEEDIQLEVSVPRNMASNACIHIASTNVAIHHNLIHTTIVTIPTIQRSATGMEFIQTSGPTVAPSRYITVSIMDPLRISEKQRQGKYIRASGLSHVNSIRTFEIWFHYSHIHFEHLAWLDLENHAQRQERSLGTSLVNRSQVPTKNANSSHIGCG
jgi:hypothetical protein